MLIEPSLGHTAAWVPHVSAHLASIDIGSLCSRLLFQDCLYVNNLRTEKVFPSGAEVSSLIPHTIRECYLWSQSLGMLTASYRRAGSLSSKVLSYNAISGVCRHHLALFAVLYKSHGSWNRSKCWCCGYCCCCE